MEFGSVSLDRALGAIAVHSVRLASGLIRKGTVLGNAEIERLRAEGHDSVVVARLDPGDVQEDVAAERLARAVAGEGVRVERPFTGRSNLYSEVAGVLVVRRALIDGINAVDESITVATLPEWRAVVPGEMIGTVKIIPFAVPGDLLDGALKEAARADAQPLGAAVSVAAFQPMRVGVVSTLLPGLKPSVVKKTVNVLQERLSIAGATVTADMQTPHETDALADAIAGNGARPGGADRRLRRIRDHRPARRDPGRHRAGWRPRRAFRNACGPRQSAAVGTCRRQVDPGRAGLRPQPEGKRVRLDTRSGCWRACR